MIATINANRPAGTPEFRYKTIARELRPKVWAGLIAAADEVGGRYCDNCHVAEVDATVGSRVGVRPYVLDPEHAKAVWALSETMIGEQF